ncbi:hypothetical protein RRV45_01480 [Bacillus sp. DTU_2020_1000418_1_SI_GHA_SEK_038]|uniref:hypothetical protein n=1 Tax=Bacillus sp. DTU_2020_1000418_1_SI_GHA_SEK_038 TaxID=3077585 RepID=UPI0028E5EDF5|nr:hypothetical protein [Bacillus sp. DTU_2020_1000418_1_SI_GHA_SEK_038]WNS75748.1 hypothetical protein RRV45_01480 [Bacillus sp. DTU_2020_1000418_1_SI_GHA_SEK_038]
MKNNEKNFESDMTLTYRQGHPITDNVYTLYYHNYTYIIFHQIQKGGSSVIRETPKVIYKA